MPDHLTIGAAVRRPTRSAIARTCEQCHSGFTTWPSTVAAGAGRFCSKRCYDMSRAIQDRVCAECGGIYRRHRSKGRFCGVTCRNMSNRVAIEPRFWAKVNKTDTCWLWTGPLTNGYGYINYQGRFTKAARIVWMLTYGPIPPKTVVRHFVCDNPPCVRPDHLRLGSHHDNMADRQAKGRQPRGATHGHSKLTDDDIRTIRVAIARGDSQGDIAALFGVARSQISRISRGERWSHVV